MYVSDGMQIVTTRLQLNMHINVYLYEAVCALIWVACAHSTGIYHRHVFADGYALNLLLLKASAYCWIMVCALNFIIQTNVWFYTICWTALVVWIVEMIVRFVARRFLTYRHRKGRLRLPHSHCGLA